METDAHGFVDETCRWISWRFLAFRKKAADEPAAPSESDELHGWSLGVIRENKNAYEEKMALVAADFGQSPKTPGQPCIVVIQNGADWNVGDEHCPKHWLVFSALKQSPRSNSWSPNLVCLCLVGSFAPEACVVQMQSTFPLFLSFWQLNGQTLILKAKHSVTSLFSDLCKRASRFFLSNLSIGVGSGICYPYDLRMFIYVQSPKQRDSNLNGVFGFTVN